MYAEGGGTQVFLYGYDDYCDFETHPIRNIWAPKTRPLRNIFSCQTYRLRNIFFKNWPIEKNYYYSKYAFCVIFLKNWRRRRKIWKIRPLKEHSGLIRPFKEHFFFKTHPFRNILLAQTHPLRSILSLKTTLVSSSYPYLQISSAPPRDAHFDF